MSRRSPIRYTLFLCIGAVIGYFTAQWRYEKPCNETNVEQCILRIIMRTLFTDHIIWTRNYLLAALADSPDAQPVSKRLLKNTEDIGNMLIPYYGKEAGQKVTSLLKKHVIITIDLISAIKSDNHDKFKELDIQWHDSAIVIAHFFSTQSQYLPQETVIKVLNAHLILTTEEISARLSKNWKDDITTFDKIVAQALAMADHFTKALIQQFPQKF